MTCASQSAWVKSAKGEKCFPRGCIGSTNALLHGTQLQAYMPKQTAIRTSLTTQATTILCFVFSYCSLPVTVQSYRQSIITLLFVSTDTKLGHGSATSLLPTQQHILAFMGVTSLMTSAAQETAPQCKVCQHAFADTLQ